MSRPSPENQNDYKPEDFTPARKVQNTKDRLDSWKEIAVYLSREIRTVQRWEKREGMPVHRHIHLKGSTVYALKEEINVWLTRRSQSPSKPRPMQRRSRQAADELNPPPHVIRQMLNAFALWLAVVAKDSYQNSDDMVVPAPQRAPSDSHSLTQRPQSNRKARARQVVTHPESRPLSIAHLRECVKLQSDQELHQSRMGKTQLDFPSRSPGGLV